VGPQGRKGFAGNGALSLDAGTVVTRIDLLFRCKTEVALPSN
jgi:hypothetical protein